MFRYMIVRGLSAIPVLIGVSIGVFIIMHLVPGDPAMVMLGTGARPAEYEALRRNLGLDQPVFVQYWRYILRLFHGNLGHSITSGKPILASLLQRLPVTIELTSLSLLFSLLIGIPLGTISAVYRGTFFDNGSTIFALLGVSAPPFWVGIMLIFVFAYILNWFPASGYMGLAEGGILGFFKHLFLPVITLGLAMAGLLARMTRSTLLDILSEDYIQTGRSKGLRETVVVIKHALRNALLPLVTITGLRFARMMGGAVVTETVFALPGVGRYVVYGMQSQDFPVVQGVVLLVAIMVVIVNILVDFIYVFLDPRIRYD